MGVDCLFSLILVIVYPQMLPVYCQFHYKEIIITIIIIIIIITVRSFVKQFLRHIQLEAVVR